MQILRRLIKEIILLENLSLSEGYVTLSTEDALMEAAEELFNLIKRNEASLKEKILQKDEAGKFVHNSENPLITYKKFFKLESRTKNNVEPVVVDVGLFVDDPDEDRPSNGNFMFSENGISELGINLEFALNSTLKRFQRLIYHELIHAQDPLVRNKEADKKYIKGMINKRPDSYWKVDPSEEEREKNYELRRDQYLNSTHEFTAFIGELIYDIKRMTKNDPEKISLMKDLMFLLLKNNDKGKMSDEEHKLASRILKLGMFSDFSEYFDFSYNFRDKSSYWLKNPKNRKKLRKYLGQSFFNSMDQVKNREAALEKSNSDVEDKSLPNQQKDSLLGWIGKLFSKFL